MLACLLLPNPGFVAYLAIVKMAGGIPFLPHSDN